MRKFIPKPKVCACLLASDFPSENPRTQTTHYSYTEPLATSKKTMRIALIILIGIHGIIHLFGFLKAFGISEFNAITQPISKTFGLVWLLTFILCCNCFTDFNFQLLV